MKLSAEPKKLALSTLFVAMLTIPAILGAIPLKVVTPAGIVSTEVQEAEARNRNTSANRPRSLSARNSGAQLVQRFSANRRSYTVNVRENTNRANIRIGIREGQQHRWRIDTRSDRGNWRNGSYNSWRARANRNINRDVRVNVNQGQERRLRVQIRDRSGNVRTITINVRRASGNTWNHKLLSNAGVFLYGTRINSNGRSSIYANNTLIIPHNRTATTQVGTRASQERGMTRNRVRIQNANGQWSSWSSWSSYRRGQSTRNVSTIPEGRRAQVQFMIRGAFSEMPNSPTRTRTYTVNVERLFKWDVLGPFRNTTLIDSNNLGLTLNRPFHPNVLNYTVTVPRSVQHEREMKIPLGFWRGAGNPLSRDFEILLRPTNLGWAPIPNNVWLPANRNMPVEMTVEWQGQNNTPPMVYQVRHIPTGEVRTYTFNFVAAP